jgi:hypothetical protein
MPGICQAVVSVAERVYSAPVADRALLDVVYPRVEELIHCRGEPERINAIGRALLEVALTNPSDYWVHTRLDPESWDGFAHLAYFPFASHTPHYRRVPAELHSADLLREVFPNPFQERVPFNGEWRSLNVLQLARNAHAACNFSTLPVLADALEDAGCDQVELLDHLRHGGPHVRGCWALERVLWG